MGIRFLWALSIFLAGSAAGAESLPVDSCVPRFADLGAAEGAAPGSYASLRRELPQVRSPETLAEEFAARRRSGDTRVPENQPGVEWLKKTLSGLKDDPLFRFKDSTSDLLFRRQRDRRIQELLKKLEEVEAQGYSLAPTVEAADEVLAFLDHLVRPPGAPEDFLKHQESLPALRGKKVELPREEISRLKELYLKSYTEKAIGEQERRNSITYDEALLSAVEKRLSELGQRINLRKEYRLFEYRFGFQDDPSENVVHSALGSAALRSGKVLVLAPGEISVRALSEAVLFRIEPLGLVSHPVLADRSVMRPERFLEHDLNHVSLSLRDPISQKLIEKTVEQKRELLRSIDAIAEPANKELAEYALMIALREAPSSIFRPQNATLLQSVAGKFRFAMGREISEEEARWSLDWWKGHLPFPR